MNFIQADENRESVVIVEGSHPVMEEEEFYANFQLGSCETQHTGLNVSKLLGLIWNKSFHCFTFNFTSLTGYIKQLPCTKRSF